MVNLLVNLLFSTEFEWSFYWFSINFLYNLSNFTDSFIFMQNFETLFTEFW